MEIRPFRPEDTPTLVELSRDCARGETDFVLNPFWESEAELRAEFERFGIAPEEHVLVADGGAGEVLGMVGFLRQPDARAAGIFCPIVRRGERGHGLGGELLRAAQELGTGKLGISLMTAGIGTRNRAGYSLLTSHGFRPARQTFLMKCDTVAADAPVAEGVRLESATPADAEEILEIYTECGFDERSPEAMRGVFEDGRHAHVVAREGRRLVGFVELETHWPERVWVAFVGVRKQERDHGLGTHLTAFALRQQFEAGARQALLMLSPANRTALRAYEKAGFRRARMIDVLEKSF